MMTKLFNAALFYLILGLAAGVYYRELTHLSGFPHGEHTQLSVVHTHVLALGFMLMLIVLALEKLWSISKSRLFAWFYWVYNSGLVVTVTLMVWHGTLTVLGQEAPAAVPGIAGAGHILLAAGLVLLMVCLRRALKAFTTSATGHTRA